jgi:hypothetical protein
MINGLRLNYPNSNFATNRGYATLEFDLPNADSASVPYSASMGTGGTAANPYPFTGNGFISTVDGKIRPEYTLGGGIGIPDNTILKKYAPDGTLLGQSTWSTTTSTWTPPLAGL